MGECSEVGRLDPAVLKYQAEDPETTGSHGGCVSSGGAQSRFINHKNPSEVGVGRLGG